MRGIGHGCGAGCAAGGCRDLSSRRDMGRLLTSPAVVGEILAAAWRKTSQRARAFAAGDMTEEEVVAADVKLSAWLADTFSGANPAFGTTENWNPEWLAGYLEENFAEVLRQALGREPESPEDWVRAAALQIVASIRTGIQRSEPGADAPDAFLSEWAAILTGAPVPGTW